MESLNKGQFLDERNLNSELGMLLPADRQIDWSTLLTKMRAATSDIVPNITKRVLQVHPHREAFQLFGVLTPEECAHLIAETESIGYQPLSGYSQQYRSNTRRIIVYEELRDIIWSRIKDFMRQELAHNTLKSKWRAYGLNPQFRFCRYEPGQKFAAHYDGNFALSSENKSFYTFMIYLNGGFDGGATNFLSDSATPPRGNVLESLAPEAGMLLVFQHNIYHEGEELRGGLKYMMRSDVMYRLETDSQEDSTLARQTAEAQELLNLAEQFESQGKHAEAVQLYKKAYKIAPQLEFASSFSADVAVPDS